jgi:hypothetical protein
MAKIEQARFSRSIVFFEKDFLKLYSLKRYTDENAPCIFMGVYGQDGVDVINAHKGKKIVLNTGAMRSVFLNINSVNTVISMPKGVEVDVYGKYYNAVCSKYSIKKCNFPLKDFSYFKPDVFGDKIYCYLGSKTRAQQMGAGLINELKGKLKFEILIGYQGHSIKDLKTDFYDKCFLNIKPNLTGGFTTAIELAYMGRKTISSSTAPFCINYNTMDDVLNLINKESKKIGTTQPSCVGTWFDTEFEWLNTEFWLTS